MSIASGRPTSGLRIRLEREPDTRQYAGAATSPSDEWPCTAQIDPAGAVTVQSPAPADIVEKIRLLVRTALRHAEDDGRELPRTITRWRAP